MLAQPRKIVPVVLLGLGTLLLAGCGGRQVVATKPVEMTIPPELVKAFEVKELPAAATPAPAPEAVSEAKPRRGAKKRSRKKKSLAKTNAVVTPAAPSAGMAGPGNTAFKIPDRRPVKNPIWVGEKIWLDVTWLNTKAGEFELEVLPFKEMNGRKVYDLKGTAHTSDLFSLIYKAEDWVESFVDYEGLFPYKFVLHGDETKHIRNNLELFDHAAKKQFIATHDNRIQKNEIVEEKNLKDLTPFSQDSLSAIYYVRTLQFEEGKTLRFPMTTNGNQWQTEVTILGREEVQTKMGYLKSFKTKIETRFNGSLQQQGDAFMWFSDDDRKYLLRFEAKVRIGWVAGIARQIEPGVPPEEKLGGAKPASEPAEGSSNKDKSSSRASPPSSNTSAYASDESPARPRRVWFHQLLESLSATKK